MLLDFESLKQSDRYKLMSQVIVPRPIAWAVTEDQSINIAPFSFFSGISSNPPTVMLAVGHKSPAVPKDTLANIRKNKKCVICSVEPRDLEPMHYTSAMLDHEISESELFDIKTHTLVEGFPPVIEGVKTAMFCTLIQEVELEGSMTVPLFLKIEHLYIEEGCVDEKLHLQLDLLGRLGKEYVLMGEKIKAPVIPVH